MDGEIIKDLGAYEIQQYQQNRYPCFFLDHVDEICVGKYAKGYKNFSFNEWFFPCHFSDDPNVPGFIQIETLTQMFLMTFLSLPDNKGKRTSFVSVNNVKFKKKVIPGNKLEIYSELKSYRRGVAIGSSTGYINGDVACSADFIIAIPDVLNQFNPKK